ncbi:MAG TPA: hypothetical protein DCE44_08905 [Verrucomicrobiales bacterium]|nr:hypothetical protein [Verrucomicrobiales bacterium]
MNVRIRCGGWHIFKVRIPCDVRLSALHDLMALVEGGVRGWVGLWFLPGSRVEMAQVLGKLVAGVAEFTGRHPFRLGRFRIVLVVMTQAEEHQVLFRGVGVIPVNVGDLAFLEFIPAFQKPA